MPLRQPGDGSPNGGGGSLLEINQLRVELKIGGSRRTIIHDVSLDIARGEALGVVGESGAGKSMTIRAILGMLPTDAGVTGSIRFDGRDIAAMDAKVLRRYRAHDVGVVFQDPRAHINPVRRIGDFLTEPLVRLRGIDPKTARRRVKAILEEIGVDDGEQRFRQFPHELSGGLLQRMMIAAVVAMEPRLILADEPTTALDVTTQADVMAILGELQRARHMALLLVTHDLDLAAAVCDRMAVMYAGSVVEHGAAGRIIARPLHPYSAGLGASRPVLANPGETLLAISGRPLSAFEVPPGCPFAPRCRYAQQRCRERRPALRPVAAGWVACRRAEEIQQPGGLGTSEDTVGV
jgi:peptide/nickel transport system ATP-binding protein